MKLIYKYLLSLAVSATILPACRDEANQVVEQGVAKKHSRTLKVSTPDEAGGARAMLVANQGTKDFYVHWSAGDKVQIFCQQGQHFLDLGSFPLEHIAEDKRSAQLNISYPDVIDLEKPYTLYGVYGAAAKYTPIGQSVGGKHTADEGLVFDASPIIGKPVSDFRPPLYFKQEIDPKVSGNALQFAHYGTYEIVKMENASKQAVRVLAPQLASSTDELWYAYPASNKSNLFLPSKDTTQEASLLAVHQTGVEQTLQSGESRVFVNWYRPTDTPLTKAKLVATIDGVKQISTERVLPKAMTLQVGRAYHLTVVWDGKKLTYDQVEEEVNGKNIVWDKISPSDYKLSADGLTLIIWKNPSTRNLDMNRDSRLRKIVFIREYAFNACSNLTSINISSSVTGIGKYALYDRSGLMSVTIPSSVTSIGESAFEACIRLTSVTIPSSVTSIGGSAFENCRSLTSVNISSSVTSIGGEAFRGCGSLTSITIPSSVTSIGSSTFRGCSSLTSVTIPSSVTSIGSYAFADCRSLTSINIPSSVKSIGDRAFRDCIRLTSIIIPSSVSSIGSYAFDGCSSLMSITIPSSVTSIGEAAFQSCSRLKDVIIPSSVTSIVQFAFSGCSSLTSITIPSSVTRIKWRAFSGCSSLTSVTIPSSVKSIEDRAFRDCSRLTSITIPSSVTDIGDQTFYNCRSLTSVVFKGNEPPGYFHSNIFEDTPGSLKLIVPKGAKSAYREAGYPANKLVEE